MSAEDWFATCTWPWGREVESCLRWGDNTVNNTCHQGVTYLVQKSVWDTSNTKVASVERQRVLTSGSEKFRPLPLIMLQWWSSLMNHNASWLEEEEEWGGSIVVPCSGLMWGVQWLWHFGDTSVPVHYTEHCTICTGRTTQGEKHGRKMLVTGVVWVMWCV